MNEDNILYKNDEFPFHIIKRGDEIGIDMRKITVGVLPYKIKDGLLSEVGIVHEYLPFRPGGYSNVLITGTITPDDKDLLSGSKRELTEESGFVQDDDEAWTFLGSMLLSKASNEVIHTYGVNVSDIEQGDILGDGSIKEENSTFKMVPINEAILTDESLFLAAYLRLFDTFYQKLN